MDLALALIPAFTLLISAGTAVGLAAYVGRRASKDVIHDLRDDWEHDRLKTANLRNEIVEYFERSSQAAQRARSSQAAAESAKSRKAAAAGGANGSEMSEADYKAHLARGGPIILELEARFAGES